MPPREQEAPNKFIAGRMILHYRFRALAVAKGNLALWIGESSGNIYMAAPQKK